MQLRTVDLDGPYHYADYGGDGEPIVLVHGIGGSHINWMHVAPQLTERFHVYAVDQLGFGFTPLAGRHAYLPTQAGYIERFIAEVAGGPATVVGHSMGGLVSMLLASESPAVVRRLVLVDPAACVIRSTAPLPTWLMVAFGTVPSVGGRIAGVIPRSRGADAIVREALNRDYAPGHDIDPGLLAAHVDVEKRRAALPTPYRGYIEGWLSMRNVHAERQVFLDDVVARIKAPTLLVVGTKDPLIPQRWFRRLALARPDWTTTYLEGVGHDPQMEVPDIFVAAVIAWLNATPAAAVGALAGS